MSGAAGDGGGQGGGESGGWAPSAGNPPRLGVLSTTPAHELGAVTRMLGIRPIVLWQWEQQLRAIAPGLLTVATTTHHVYADRDLGALLWLRDALMSGASFSGATATLLAAQSPQPQEAPRSAYVNSLGADPASSAPGQSFGATASSSASLYGGAPQSRPLVGAVSAAGAWSMLRIASAYDLQYIMPPLVRAFAAFDQRNVNRIVQETLTTHTVEDICLNLLQPALLRIGELRARRQITSAGDHFATNYVKGLLFSTLHTTAEQRDAPLILMGCGPGETQDLNALLLAVFWRRAGLRVRYLGANVNAADLIEETQTHRPALVALSVMTASRVRALTRLANAIRRLPPPRPIFAFDGAVFVGDTKLQQRIAGVYLGDDAAAATWQARRLLDGAADEPLGNTEREN